MIHSRIIIFSVNKVDGGLRSGVGLGWKEQRIGIRTLFIQISFELHLS